MFLSAPLFLPLASAVFSNNDLILRLVPKLKCNTNPSRLTGLHVATGHFINLFVFWGRLKYDSGKLPLMFKILACCSGPVNCSWHLGPFFIWGEMSWLCSRSSHCVSPRLSACWCFLFYASSIIRIFSSRHIQAGSETVIFFRSYPLDSLFF